MVVDLSEEEAADETADKTLAQAQGTDIASRTRALEEEDALAQVALMSAEQLKESAKLGDINPKDIKRTKTEGEKVF